ncbi:unnamed protein product [Adineta steineri]|uniref:Uncharacterized protein n=1 Tax=Adineta steineri TaxID=433720 RepID=A0A815AEK1_9BILA|nr:unnamed protein product [Adineta steineri]CAF1546746.1 unnamed protein product [Adineta steineri]
MNLQALCNLLQAQFELHPDPERESKVCATLSAFYVFHRRANDYAQLREASVASISQRLFTLFDTAATLVLPDCPELLMEQDDASMILFQKINRYLFQELDFKLEEYVHAETSNLFTLSSLMILPCRMLSPLPSLPVSSSMPLLSSLFELPLPPIEWAVNIIEELDYTVYLALQLKPPLIEWIQTIIDKHYNPNSLMLYLCIGWDAVMARYYEIIMTPIGTNHRAQVLNAFIDRLRNTMCYPARVSIVSACIA